MEKNTIRAFDLNDFPFSGGIFTPKFKSAAIDMITVENKKIGTTTQLIKSAKRLGKTIIPKGARVASRLQYIVKNHTQNFEGRIELVGFENEFGEIKFFVAASIPLNAGDELDVRFECVVLNSHSENLH